PGTAGAFALYRMEKQGWTTPDALAVVRRRWRVEPRRLSYGGPQDRHAATVPYFTVFPGPRRHLEPQGIAVPYPGPAPPGYPSHHLLCNRFVRTLRDLADEARRRVEERLPAVAADGVPNYFDDQRFGSVAAEGGEFVAKLLVRGRFEEALRLALAGPYEHDRA